MLLRTLRNPAFKNLASLQKFSTASRPINLVSDTVTLPCDRMKEAMVNCALGDDVMEDDPTVKYVERTVADFFGKEAALYVSSGTMSNLISMMLSCPERGQSALIGNKSHIYQYERAGISAIGGIMPQVIPNLADGTFDLNVVQENISPAGFIMPQQTVLVIENTQCGVGGRTIPYDYVLKAKKLCKKNKIRMHLDGARLLNAMVATGQDVK